MRPGVGAAHDDLGALGGLADLDDVGLHPGAGLGPLVGHLLGLGQQRLDPTEVEQRVAAVALLDDAGDDVALAAGVLLVLHLALGLADALAHHLLGGLRGDAAEVVGRDVELVADRLAVLVELLGHHPDLAGVGVDGDPGVLVGAGHPLVGRLEGVGERAEQRVDRDALVGGQRLQRVHQVGVRHDAFALFVFVWFFELSPRVLLAWFGRARLRLAAPLEDGAGLLDVVVGERRARRRRLAITTARSSRRGCVPVMRRSPSKPGTVLIVTCWPTAHAKWAGVRRGRSRPGLDTSRVYLPGDGIGLVEHARDRPGGGGDGLHVDAARAIDGDPQLRPAELEVEQLEAEVGDERFDQCS